MFRCYRLRWDWSLDEISEINYSVLTGGAGVADATVCSTLTLHYPVGTNRWNAGVLYTTNLPTRFIPTFERFVSSMMTVYQLIVKLWLDLIKLVDSASYIFYNVEHYVKALIN